MGAKRLRLLCVCVRACVRACVYIKMYIANVRAFYDLRGSKFLGVRHDRVKWIITRLLAITTMSRRFDMMVGYTV